MIKLITGAKGTGKTKIIINMANDNVDTAKGDIVFLTDTDRYMYSLRYQVRVINTECLKRAGQSAVDERELVGFCLLYTSPSPRDTARWRIAACA